MGAVRIGSIAWAFELRRAHDFNISARLDNSAFGRTVTFRLFEGDEVHTLVRRPHEVRTMLAAVRLGFEQVAESGDWGCAHLMIAGQPFSWSEAKALKRVLAAMVEDLDAAEQELVAEPEAGRWSQ